jgi:hypothetical protein
MTRDRAEIERRNRMPDTKTQKIERLKAVLSHREGNRVPVSDFFRTGFMEKAQEQWGQDLDIYRKFDPDYIVINPNMDPIIRDFEILEDDGVNIKLKTGFGATVRRSGKAPMPHFDSFSVSEPEEMENFVIEPAKDKRRLYSGGRSDQRPRRRHKPEPSLLERQGRRLLPGLSCLRFYPRRLRVPLALYRLGEFPVLEFLESDRFGAFVRRIGDFLAGLTEYQITRLKKAGEGFRTCTFGVMRPMSTACSSVPKYGGNILSPLLCASSKSAAMLVLWLFTTAAATPQKSTTTT